MVSLFSFEHLVSGKLIGSVQASRSLPYLSPGPRRGKSSSPKTFGPQIEMFSLQTHVNVLWSQALPVSCWRGYHRTVTTLLKFKFWSCSSLKIAWLLGLRNGVMTSWNHACILDLFDEVAPIQLNGLYFIFKIVRYYFLSLFFQHIAYLIDLLIACTEERSDFLDFAI